MFEVSIYSQCFFTSLMYLSMISEPIGGVILISEFALDKSDCLSGLPFPEERNKAFLSMTDCQFRVIRLWSSNVEKKYTSKRLFRALNGSFIVQDNISFKISLVIFFVRIRASLIHFVSISTCIGEKLASKVYFASASVFISDSNSVSVGGGVVVVCYVVGI